MKDNTQLLLIGAEAMQMNKMISLTEHIYRTALVYAQYKDMKNNVDDHLIEEMIKDIHLLCSEYSVDFKKITQKIHNESGVTN